MCVAVYHCKCIDTWLVQDSDLCPLCKKSVIDEDLDQEAGATGGVDHSADAPATHTAAAAARNVNNVPDDDDREDAPLLHSAGRRRPRPYGSRIHGSSVSVKYFQHVIQRCTSFSS